MKIKNPHDWNITPREARELQNSLRDRLKFQALKKTPRLVAGADISYNRGDDLLFAGVAVLRVPEMEIVETKTVCERVSFPYIPGYLSFREIPPLFQARREATTAS